MDRPVFDREKSEYLLRHIKHTVPCPTVYKTVDSTSTRLKALAECGAPEYTLIMADKQTGGRGRVGKSFHSPEGGVYMSLLLRPGISVSDAHKITPCAAVAVAEVLEELFGVKASVKWVNDLFLGGKKICGILTEAPYDMETGGVKYVIVGIGINLFEPEGGFGELDDIAGAVFDGTVRDDGLKLRVAAHVTDRFIELLECGNDAYVFSEYKKRLFILGRNISVIRGTEHQICRVISLSDDYSLETELPDGTTEKLISGEISIIPEGNS